MIDESGDDSFSHHDESLPAPSLSAGRRSSLTSLIVVLFAAATAVVSAGVGGFSAFLYSSKASHLYESATTLLIECPKNSQPNLGATSPQSHVQLLRSPIVLDAAVKTFRLHELSSFSGVPDTEVARQIADGMTIRRLDEQMQTASNNDGTSMHIEIRYRSTNFVDTMTVLKAVARAYRNFLDEQHEVSAGTALRMIRNASEVVESRLTKSRSDLERLKKKLPPGALTVADEPNPAEVEAERLRVERGKLGDRHETLKALLNTVDDAQREGRPAPSILELLRRGMAQLDAKPKSSQRAPSSQDENPFAVSTTPTDTTSQLKVEIETGRLLLEQFEAEDRAFAERLAAAESEGRLLRSLRAEADRLQLEIRQNKELFDQVMLRAQETDLEFKETRVAATVVQDADDAQRVWPTPWLVPVATVMSGIGGFLVALVVGLCLTARGN